MLSRASVLASAAFLFLLKLGCTPAQPTHLQARPEIKPAASASISPKSAASVVELDVFPPLRPERPRGPAPKMVSIGVGPVGTCAVDDQGRLYCWGLVPDGKKDMFDTYRPVRIAGIDDAIAVRGSPSRPGFCLLRRSHPVTCWGLDIEDALHEGAFRELPQLHVERAEDLFPGQYAVCAIGADRKVTCVSDELGGEFPDWQIVSMDPGGMGLAAITPQGVRCDGDPTLLCGPLTLLGTRSKLGLPGIRQISTIWGMGCALGASGVRCWGMDVDESPMDQAGNHIRDASYIPRPVPPFQGVEQIAVEGDGVVDGRFADGRVERFRFQGKRGQGTSRTVLQSGVRDLQASDGRACALLQDGGVRCWGNADGGWLGDNSLPYVTAPRPIDGIVDARRVWMGLGTYVQRSDGVVLLYGFAADRTIARGQVLSSGAASDQVLLCPEERYGEQLIRGPEGTVHCPISGLESAVEVAKVEFGGEHKLLCGRFSDGTVRCKGTAWFQDKSEIGREVRFEPDKVLGGDALALQPGPSAICVLQRDGGVRCPAAQRLSNLGVERGRPILLPSKGAIRRIAWSVQLACALDADGAVYCDDETGASVHRIQGLPLVQDIVAGGGFFCALTQSGHVFCWGNNESGQLGVGDADAHDHPVQARGLTHVVELKAKGASACARTQSGQVHCWGMNRLGETGQPVPNRDSPVVEPMW